MLSRPFILVCAASLAGSMSVAAATAPGINPTADAFVGSANPGNNYGAAGALEVSAPGSTKGEFDSFVRFNLGSTKAYFDGLYGANNWTVQSITLQLTTSAPNNALFNASTAGMFSIQLNHSDAWVEGAGTPSAPDTTPSDLNFTNHTNYEGTADPSLGMYSFAGGTSGTSTYTLGLSTGLLADVQSGSDASL